MLLIQAGGILEAFLEEVTSSRRREGRVGAPQIGKGKFVKIHVWHMGGKRRKKFWGRKIDWKKVLECQAFGFYPEGLDFILKQPLKGKEYNQKLRFEMLTLLAVGTLFSWAPKSLQMVIAAMKLKDACSLEEKLWPTYTAY